MAQQVIPEPWRKDVCAILATEATGTLIEWKIDAEKRYQATPDALWNYEVYQPFIDFLSSPAPTGVTSRWIRPQEKPMSFISLSRGSGYMGKFCYAPTGNELSFFQHTHP
ncbi:MAG: hypothetical protein ABSE97_09955 [Verrucomicrobiota bacterium]|jgi:hypothetical protein